MHILPDWISPGALLGLQNKESFWLYTVVRVLVRHDSLIETWRDNENLITTSLRELYNNNINMLVLSREYHAREHSELLEVLAGDGEHLIIWCANSEERKSEALPFMLLC